MTAGGSPAAASAALDFGGFIPTKSIKSTGSPQDLSCGEALPVADDASTAPPAQELTNILHLCCGTNILRCSSLLAFLFFVIYNDGVEYFALPGRNGL